MLSFTESCLMENAKNGDAEAQLDVGVCFYTG